MKFDQSQISRFFARDRFLRPYDRPPFASKVNRRHPLALGLVGCWLLNEGAGNEVLDSSGNRNDLSNNGALWIKDHRGGVLDFASPDYGLIADHDSLDLTNTGTIIVKARLDSLSTNHTLVCKKDDAAYDAATGFCFTVEMPFERFYLYGSGANWLISDIVTPYLDTTNYHQFAANWKDSVGALFLDGIDRTESSSITTPVANTKDLYIGRWDFHSIFLDGKIEFVYIFNRQLLNSEISSIYQEPYQFIQPPQIARQFFVPAVVTTAAPTTPAPTTAAPTSLAPTTAAPTSLAPTTLAPTSLAPTSLAPTTYAITTYPPSTAPPTSLAPTTAAPTSLAPTTPAPTSLAPTSLAPTSLAPTSLAPTSLAPTSLAPTTAAPTSLAPTSLAPTSLVPTTPAPEETSYDNPDGDGARWFSIQVTTTMTFAGGSLQLLVDGAAASGTLYGNDPDISGDYLRFEFLDAVVIDEAKWYQSTATSHGTVKWQGSNNGSDWDDIGSSFTLGGATTQTQTQLNGNTTAYKYYRLLGISGVLSITPYIYEIDFKIGVPPKPRYIDNLGVEDRSALIVVTMNGLNGTGSNLVNDMPESSVWGVGASAGKWMKFDFGVGNAQIIEEALFLQASGESHGDWKWQGSDNDSDWDDIGSSFTLGGSVRQTHTELNGNTTEYRYYRLLGVSGNMSSTPYLHDFLFRIGLPPFLTSSAPTTLAPTSLAPTSLAPTSLAPTSLAPTSLAPTSLAPTSLAPTTPIPTTPIPTTAAPTSLAPTSLAPTSLAPTSLAPTSLAPTSLAPTSVAPTTVAPTTVAPTSLAPTSLPPTTVAPTTVPATTVVPTTLAPTTLAVTTPVPISPEEWCYLVDSPITDGGVLLSPMTDGGILSSPITDGGILLSILENDGCAL